MDLSLSEEQQAFRDLARDFLEREAVPPDPPEEPWKPGAKAFPSRSRTVSIPESARTVLYSPLNRRLMRLHSSG